MTTTPGTEDGADRDLDFWSFVDAALHRLEHEGGFEHVEATRLLLTLNRAADLITYDLESTVHRPRGRSWATYRLLFVTWLAGPFEPTAAARLTGMSRAAVSSLIKTLVADGLLDRSPAPHDGRSVRLSLTERGEQVITATFGEQNEREHQWAEALSAAEREQLVRLLNKLVSGPHRFSARARS